MLPKTKTPPKSSLADLMVLLYGPSKIGKSTFCSQAPGHLFLATESGLNSLDTYQVPITNWAALLDACKDLATTKHDFKTVVIDTVDNAYRMCQEHICEKAGVEHPADQAYGKGFAAVNNEFLRVLTKLSLLPYGLFLVSHSRDIEQETRTGTVIKTVPTLPGKAREIALGLVDMILFADLELDNEGNGTRVIRTKPNGKYEAGDRTGKLPETIELDYAKFIAAFEAKNGTTKKGAKPTPKSVDSTL